MDRRRDAAGLQRHMCTRHSSVGGGSLHRTDCVRRVAEGVNRDARDPQHLDRLDGGSCAKRNWQNLLSEARHRTANPESMCVTTANPEPPCWTCGCPGGTASCGGAHAGPKGTVGLAI